MKVAALGFLSTAIGLFIIPHDAGPGRLAAAAASAAAADHGRSLAGLLLIAAGIVLGLSGWALTARQGAPAA